MHGAQHVLRPFLFHVDDSGRQTTSATTRYTGTSLGAAIVGGKPRLSTGMMPNVTKLLGASGSNATAATCAFGYAIG
jgi:hypothetical protein